jgi:putative ABC transport system permease protein
VNAVEPGLPVYEMRTMQQVLREDLAGTDLLVSLLTAFAAVALVVAAPGVFGVLWRLGQGLRLTSTGLALGACGGIAAG